MSYYTQYISFFYLVNLAVLYWFTRRDQGTQSWSFIISHLLLSLIFYTRHIFDFKSRSIWDLQNEIKGHNPDHSNLVFFLFVGAVLFRQSVLDPSVQNKENRITINMYFYLHEPIVRFIEKQFTNIYILQNNL
jgi:hypothetical protein